MVIAVMRSFLLLLLFSFSLLLSACSGGAGDGSSYPQTREEREEARIGKLGSGDGIKLFGGGSSTATKGINVNSYLWRATLDTVYFMPLISADPFGGTVLTDWYSISQGAKSRYKVNVLIIGSYLRSDAIRVSVFKQSLDETGHWIDDGSNKEMATDIEAKILTRARELRVHGIK